MPATDAGAVTAQLEADHTLLCEAVRAAGAAVLRRYRGRPVRSWQKADASPVSEADLEANEILHTALITARPGYGWLSEETRDDRSRLDAHRTFIIDPLDGTRAFLNAQPEFTVTAALVEDGRAISAAIFNPVTDEFYEAVAGGGSRCNGVTLNPSRCTEVGGCRILAPRAFSKRDWSAALPQVHRSYRCSTAYRFALVAKGVYDATVAMVPKQDWDVAPGALIATEAGALASDGLGGPFEFNCSRPVQQGVVCAAPALYPALIAHLKDHAAG